MKYLKYFKEASAYEAYKSGSDYVLPNVSYIVDGAEVKFNPNAAPASPNLVCTYNVTDTSQETHILNHYGLPYVTNMIINGVEMDADTYYQFDTVGDHMVEFVLDDPTNIGRDTFAYCSNLTSIIIPDSVTEIGSIFYDCKNLTNISIGSGVTYIQSGIFNSSRNVTITISNNNPTYDNRGNCNCIIETATNTIIAGWNNSFIPDSVTNLGEYAFYGCSLLTSIELPASLTSIGNSAFGGCFSLASIEIPNSVISIGNSAFSRCSGLTSVTLGDSVTTIDACNRIRNLN